MTIIKISLILVLLSISLGVWGQYDYIWKKFECDASLNFCDKYGNDIDSSTVVWELDRKILDCRSGYHLFSTLPYKNAELLTEFLLKYAHNSFFLRDRNSPCDSLIARYANVRLYFKNEKLDTVQALNTDAELWQRSIVQGLEYDKPLFNQATYHLVADGKTEFYIDMQIVISFIRHRVEVLYPSNPRNK